MARKMKQAHKAFIDALENGDGSLAKQHLTEVQKLSDFLAEDLQSEIAKSDVVTPQGPRDIFAGGAPVLTFENATKSMADNSNRLGFTSSSKFNRNHTRSAGSYGRKV